MSTQVISKGRGTDPEHTAYSCALKKKTEWVESLQKMGQSEEPRNLGHISLGANVHSCKCIHKRTATEREIR